MNEKNRMLHDQIVLDYLGFVSSRLGAETRDLRSAPGPADGLVRLPNGTTYWINPKTRSLKRVDSPNVSVNKGAWQACRDFSETTEYPLLIVSDDGLCALFENLDQPHVLGGPPDAEFWLIHHRAFTHPWRYSEDALARMSFDDMRSW